MVQYIRNMLTISRMSYFQKETSISWGNSFAESEITATFAELRPI